MLNRFRHQLLENLMDSYQSKADMTHTVRNIFEKLNTTLIYFITRLCFVLSYALMQPYYVIDFICRQLSG